MPIYASIPSYFQKDYSYPQTRYLLVLHVRIIFEPIQKSNYHLNIWRYTKDLKGYKPEKSPFQSGHNLLKDKKGESTIEL